MNGISKETFFNCIDNTCQITTLVNGEFDARYYEGFSYKDYALLEEKLLRTARNLTEIQLQINAWKDRNERF